MKEDAFFWPRWKTYPLYIFFKGRAFSLGLLGRHFIPFFSQKRKRNSILFHLLCKIDFPESPLVCLSTGITINKHISL